MALWLHLHRPAVICCMPKGLVDTAPELAQEVGTSKGNKVRADLAPEG